MTKEIVQALRCTSTPGSLHEDCTGCPYYRKEQLDAELKEKLGVDTWPSCDIDKVGTDAANLIERLTAENALLKKEIRKAGCMFCARFGDCPEGFKPTGQEDCDNCAKKPDCACMKCSGIGSSTDRWEWRGAPEEGDKHE
jgi:hypothetical protein